MKLKILVKIVEKILNITGGEDERGDMYLPERLLAMALVLLAGGTAFGLYGVMKGLVWAAVAGILGLGMGIAALLCWKNQSIHVLSDETFTYTTMFGKTKTYRFRDIQGLRKNQDSLTLFVAGEKVHIESMAILSERLVTLINRELEKKA